MNKNHCETFYHCYSPLPEGGWICTYCGQVKADEKPEILSWREAAVLWGQGVEIECRSSDINEWVPVQQARGIIFIERVQYRRKPVPPQPDYSKDQGFKEGDIVMASKSMEFPNQWWPVIYSEFIGHHRDEDANVWTYARPLTAEEYHRVRHL